MNGRDVGLRLAAALHHHALVELGDHTAAGLAEQKWQQRVHEARHSTYNHPHPERGRMQPMLPVRLADGLRMLNEKTPHSHPFSLVPSPRYAIAKK